MSDRSNILKNGAQISLSPVSYIRMIYLTNKIHCIGGNHQFLIGRNDDNLNL